MRKMFFDPNLVGVIPQDIIDAANKLDEYFKSKNQDHWQLAGCSSRKSYDLIVGVTKDIINTCINQQIHPDLFSYAKKSLEKALLGNG